MTPEIKQRIEQIRRGEVPEGYVKKRKVVIPQQQGLPQIKDIASISSGSTPNRNNSEYWNGNIAWVTTGELSSGHVNHTSELITVKAVKETKMRIYPQGTLLMAMYGQGKTRGTVAILEIDAAVNQACAAIAVKEGKSKFLFYQLKNSYQDIRKLSNTGNQENLNADIIKTYQVPWAPDEEQERISTILTTQDKVIELKEKRLAGKQRQKKYLMQQLLTGKKRLPGFSEEWKKVKIGSFIKEIDERSTVNNQYEILSVTKNGMVFQSSHFNKQIASENNVGYKVVRRGNLAFSTMNLWMGSLDTLRICDTGIVSPAYKVFEFNQSLIVVNFAENYMKSAEMIWLYKANSEQGASIVRRNLDLQALLNSEVALPDISEQTAIAEVLSAADHEIDLLRQDIEQEKQKKKALMQLLLTGIVSVKT